MLPESMEVLARKGFASTEGRVDRQAIATAGLALLLRNPVGDNDAAEIADKALVSFELRAKIVGKVGDPEAEKELNNLVGSVFSLDGQAQSQLEDGSMICQASVERTVKGNGATSTRRYIGRFISDNPDVIVDHNWVPAKDRLVSASKRLKSRLVLGAERNPALAGRQAKMIAQATAEASEQLELTA